MADRKNLVVVRESSEVETDDSKETPERMNGSEKVKSRPLSARQFAKDLVHNMPAIMIQQCKHFRIRILIF